MKRAFKKLSLLTVVAIGLSAIGLAGCGSSQTDGQDEFYAFGLSSAGAILSNYEADYQIANQAISGAIVSSGTTTSGTTTSGTTTSGATSETTSPEASGATTPSGATSGEPTSGTQTTPNAEYDANVELVSNYVAMVENYLADNSLSYAETESDREGYTIKLKINAKDLNGNLYEFVLYYNETAYFSGEEHSDNGNHYGYRNNDHDLDEDEQYCYINGIMVNGDAEYTVTGEKEIEGDETELELVAMIDNDNYIVIKHEAEDNEQSFSYRIYQNGALANKFSVEVEIKNGKTEVKLTVNDGTESKTFKFERDESNGKTSIKINAIDADGNVTQLKVRLETDENGNTVYNFVNGESNKRKAKKAFHKGCKQDENRNRFDFDD